MWPFKKRKNEAKARDEPQRSRRMPNLRWINRPRADNTIQGNEAIYAAVSRIANTVASLPMHIYKDYMLVPEHPMERLLNLEPNPNFTAFGFRQTMEVLRNTEGNAYALKIPDGLGGVKRLDILNPTRVQPLRNPEDQSVWYQIQPEDGEVMYAPGFMVLNLRHMSANGQKGIRPIDVLRKSLDYDAQVKELSLQQLDGVNNAIALTVPNSSLSQEEKDDLVDRFLETYEQSGRSVLVLEGGLTATNFSNPAVDGQLLDVERITRNRVATVLSGENWQPFNLEGSLYPAEEPRTQAEAQVLLRNILSWLTAGRQRLIFDYEPGVYYLAELSGSSKWTLRNWFGGELQIRFLVQPFAYSVNASTATAVAGGGPACSTSTRIGASPKPTATWAPVSFISPDGEPGAAAPGTGGNTREDDCYGIAA